jgi:putative endonuclease
LVARRAHNPKVGGSNPSPATKLRPANMRVFLYMFTVYVLYSKKFNKTYTGITSDINARLQSHNTLGKKGWTIKYRPWEIIYTESYEKKNEALKREQELKSSRGRNFIRETILSSG